MRNFSVVILSAGVGKRLYPLTEEYHKSLVPINGKPNLINTMDILEKRARSIVVVTNEKSLHDHLEVVKSRKWKCKVNVISNPEALTTNTVTSMLRGINELRDKDFSNGVLIVEGDQIYNPSELDRMIRKWSRRKSAFFTQHRENEWEVITNDDNQMTGYRSGSTGHCMSGVAFFTSKFLNEYEKYTYQCMKYGAEKSRYYEEFVMSVSTNRALPVYDYYSEVGYSKEYDNLGDLYRILGPSAFLDLFDHYERMDCMTNQTYKVTVNDKNYILKIPGVGTEDFIDRTRERYMTEYFNANQISPKVTYSGDLTVVEYLETSRILKPTVEDMVRAAKIIGRTHKLPINDLIDAVCYHDLHKELDKYYMMLHCNNDHRIEDDPYYNELVRWIEEFIESDAKINMVVCQIDLVPNNILIYKGRAKLIDHEYSGLLNRYWDLAAFISELHISFPTADVATLENAFIEQYEKTTKFKVDIIEVNKWRVVVDFIWGVWGYAKTAAGQDYLAYGRSRLCTSAIRLRSIK